MDFYVDTQWIGSVSRALSGDLGGGCRRRARAQGRGDGWMGHGLARFTVRLQRGSSDTTGPEIGSILFAGHPLNDGDPLAAPGCSRSASLVASGVARVDVKLGNQGAGWRDLSAGRASTDPAVVDNGTHDLSVHAVDTIAIRADRIVQGLGVQIPVPPAPLIPAPRARPKAVAISGTKRAGSSKVRFG